MGGVHSLGEALIELGWPSFTKCAPHPIPYTLHPLPFTLQPAPCIVNPSPRNLHPTTTPPHYTPCNILS